MDQSALRFGTVARDRATRASLSYPMLVAAFTAYQASCRTCRLAARIGVPQEGAASLAQALAASLAPRPGAAGAAEAARGSFHPIAAAAIRKASSSKLKGPFTFAFQPSFKPA